ncbi:MAG: HAMP domain-containing histidine kinase [Chloroflexi bacterium]|nr:HAMP domain-containing histidine kinase [Chloroflexota bacterium]
MFSSLRSRLWLSYAWLIVTALGVVMFVLLLYLLRNPLLYRQTLSKLNAVETLIAARQRELAALPSQSLKTALKRTDSTFDVRLILFDADERVLFDTRADETPIAMPSEHFFRSTPTLRDDAGKVWLYTLSDLSDGTRLLVATPRPNVHLLAILRDELMPPFWGAGAIALLLSLLLAFGMARWIADPLQRMLTAAREMPAEQSIPVPVRGPHEVQELTQAFNEMVARVQDTQQAQRDFVANVSHELKTPLTSIQGFAQAILDGTTDTPESQRQAAEVIYAEAGRMHRMVLDLLDLARLDAGIAEMERSPVDLTALLRNVARKFTPQARGAGVGLHVEVADLPVVIGDGDRLAQVFTNLVDNALKHTPSGGQVILRAVRQDGEVKILVIDTGAGIPAEALPHIFERFYQVDKSRSSGGEHSSGLGLAIVREIVSAHGGRITVRSQAGQGSTFVVHLPVARPDATTILSRQDR